MSDEEFKAAFKAKMEEHAAGTVAAIPGMPDWLREMVEPYVAGAALTGLEKVGFSHEGIRAGAQTWLVRHP